jgi:hypothetical protein
LFLLLEHANKNGIFDLIDHDLVFENASTNKIKMNHIKTMLCGNFFGIDKLERLKLRQSDPLVNEFNISIKEPETVSRFLGNFSYKTTYMLREINFKVFRKLLRKSKRKAITIDIDSSVVNVEGHQERALKGYNPKKPGNRCYNLQFAFCDELKAYITGFVRSGNAENYIKEAKYDMAVGHLLLQSFWANEAIFQLMMLTYNLFLLFKMDFANGTEYRQQIKTFRLKYIFLAGKIIRTARSVIMKLSEIYTHREMYEQSFP